MCKCVYIRKSPTLEWGGVLGPWEVFPPPFPVIPPPTVGSGPALPPGCACTLCLPLKLVLLTVLDLCLFMPDPRLLDPGSLFLTDERSDAAVVGSGNKAMGTSPWLTFRSWCRTWGSIITIKRS